MVARAITSGLSAAAAGRRKKRRHAATPKRPRSIPLYGLVLAGGHSSRMKKDKANLTYQRTPQSVRTFRLLQRLCKDVYLSNRAEQKNLPGHKGLPQIHDRFRELGPAGGILSAQARHPAVAWLVVACDLPFLDLRTLRHLVRSRSRKSIATAYMSAHDGLPEPLCAIYEPRSRAILRRFTRRGVHCPRKILILSRVHLLRPINRRALDNINTPDEYRKAKAQV